jgi:hypothetical protein
VEPYLCRGAMRHTVVFVLVFVSRVLLLHNVLIHRGRLNTHLHHKH